MSNVTCNVKSIDEFYCYSIHPPQLLWDQLFFLQFFASLSVPFKRCDIGKTCVYTEADYVPLLNGSVALHTCFRVECKFCFEI